MAQRAPQFITGDFTPHWCFLPDDEYSRALDALVKVRGKSNGIAYNPSRCPATADHFAVVSWRAEIDS